MTPDSGWVGPPPPTFRRQGPAASPREIASALVAAQRWDSALPALTSALALEPQDPALLAMLVRTLRATGRSRDAVTASRQLLAVTPDEPYALRLAALVLLDVEWVDEAIELAARAVHVDPLNAANHLALSRAWAASSQPGAIARQLAAAREAVQLDPASSDAQIQIGTALAASAEPAGARAAYHEALRLDPSNSAALNNLAVLDLHAGAPDVAARRLAEALALDPHGEVPRRNLDAVAIRVLRRMGWWLVVAPIPALLAALAGRIWLMWLLVLGALLGLPLLVARWWGVLTPGQRAHLRSLPGRVRWPTWVWPGIAMLMGSGALVTAGVLRDRVDAQLVTGYLIMALYVVLIRLIAAVLRPSWRAEVAGRWERLRRR